MPTTSWAVRVSGTPAPKGSMKCIGRSVRGKVRHQLVNQLATTKPWQDLVAGAAATLVEHHALTEPLDGPLGVRITITLLPPASVKRTWPWKRSGGDVDKLARTVLDGLEQGELIRDDAQVCSLEVTKAYPHTGVPDVLAHPGALIRVYRLEDTPTLDL